MSEKKYWLDKPYHSLDYELKHRFGEKVYKISLDGGMTCPNRDGTLSSSGCIFCSGNGSGDFASKQCGSVTKQITNGINEIKQRKQVGNKFIAYFQSYTNTYAPIDKLRELFFEAISHPDVVMLSIGTRPDCIPDDVFKLLCELNKIKPVIVELGLQTTNENTVDYIRRMYPNNVYDDTVTRLHNAGLEIVTHVIAGLPGETKEDFLNTVKHVVNAKSHGIKLQLLHVLKGTDMAIDYNNHKFETLSMDTYLDWIISAISILPEDIVIHRLTGDGPKDLLIAPTWSSRKREVLNTLHKRLKEKNIWQGKDYYE